MDIPVVFRWALLALAVLQLLSLVRVLRGLRRAGPGRRGAPVWDLLDSASGLVVVAGLALADFTVVLAGLALMGVAVTSRGTRAFRARTAARPPAGA
ncbi:hypothetical protein [Streptomyces sp. NPDC058667]|uniref:hypothetical protein n=1 Tax=Streptomyces sp. NPDC058667 TaxID=3346588 RepID=UPI003652C598